MIVPLKKVRVLKDHRDVLPEIIALEMVNVDAVDRDRAGINVIEPVQQVGNRGFARAG